MSDSETHSAVDRSVNNTSAESEAGLKSAPRRAAFSAYDLVRVAFALILVAAAMLKAHQISTDPAARAGLHGPVWMKTIAISAEIALAAWIVSNLYQRLAYRVSVTVVSVFALVSLYRAVLGQSDCGCFGTWVIHPGWTLLLDISILIGLLIFPPGGGESVESFSPARPTGFFWRTCALSLLICIPMVWALLRFLPNYLQTAHEARTQILDPDAWVGQPFPLLPYLQTQQILTEHIGRGRWLAMLYHSDCPECRKWLPHVDSLARSASNTSGGTRHILIEVAGRQELISETSACVRAQLSHEYDWFVRTPVFVFLSEGTVTRVSRELP